GSRRRPQKERRRRAALRRRSDHRRALRSGADRPRPHQMEDAAPQRQENQPDHPYPLPKSTARLLSPRSGGVFAGWRAFPCGERVSFGGRGAGVPNRTRTRTRTRRFKGFRVRLGTSERLDSLSPGLLVVLGFNVARGRRFLHPAGGGLVGGIG